jgi:two-component system, NarL family, nitrate/nitrite response regulator NarL
VGLRVMEAASTLRPDVIVLDLNMPDISGLDLCRDLVESLPAIRIVILTTISDDEVEREAYRRGAAAFVRKIEMTERLPSTIRQLFANEPK